MPKARTAASCSGAGPRQRNAPSLSARRSRRGSRRRRIGRWQLRFSRQDADGGPLLRFARKNRSIHSSTLMRKPVGPLLSAATLVKIAIAWLSPRGRLLPNPPSNGDLLDVPRLDDPTEIFNVQVSHLNHPPSLRPIFRFPVPFGPWTWRLPSP